MSVDFGDAPQERSKRRASQPRVYRIVHRVRAIDAFKGVSEFGIQLYQALGLAICATFASLYYLAPIVSGCLPLWILFSRFSSPSLIVTAIWIFLAVVPHTCGHTPQNRFYRSVPLYFNAQLHFEEKAEVYRDHPKPIIFLCFPHGTISYGGWSLGALAAFRPFVSAVVDILCVMPLLRQFFLGFNICSGSRHSLRHQIIDCRRDVVLYPGGLAELFLSNPQKEQLYFNNRKGCIKLAMETGADIVVCYLFGNTQLYRLYGSSTFAKFSRLLRSSITIFWGRLGLIPFKTPLEAAVSVVIPIPDHSKDPSAISTPEILSHHEVVKGHIQRVFDTYKGLHPAYANKELTIK
eukprot:Protomagalhaensia_wolfi_Nauph_80__1702@NODE_2058_length_1228_cov_98_385198_g1606_i0_p1_GENE_NODE_2058_length_1228_cov_98_385198_g1606_i0NODE_2058_length_1228_cov_98_385198_g1606_i0_p1_ORF_typecomplete_len350_score16_04DAGAT/PF03982_13/1_1e38_NODE_2058_length_1228_cov_98_385198_g1606_i01101159